MSDRLVLKIIEVRKIYMTETDWCLWTSQLANRLPKAALLDPDTYRKERLYKEGLEKVLMSKIEGLRALFQV